MKLFRKSNSKKQENSNPVPIPSDTETLKGFIAANSINEESMSPPRTSPIPSHYNGSFTTSVDYYIPNELSDFISAFPKSIENFVNEAKLDEYNIDFFEKRIADIIQIALTKLELQKANHSTVIEDLRVYREAELSKMEAELAIMEEELASKKRFLATLMETEVD